MENVNLIYGVFAYGQDVPWWIGSNRNVAAEIARSYSGHDGGDELRVRDDSKSDSPWVKIEI